MGTIPFDPRRALPAPPGFPEDWDPADPRTAAERSQAEADAQFWDDLQRRLDGFSFGLSNKPWEPPKWTPEELEAPAGQLNLRKRIEGNYGALGEPVPGSPEWAAKSGFAAPVAPPKDANTVTPPGTAGAGSGGTGISAVRPGAETDPAWWNDGKDNAFHPDIVDLGEGLSRYSSPGGRTTWDVPAHEGVDPSGSTTQYGSVTASMAPGWTPGHEDLTGLKRHAVNAADFQVPNPAPPPPVPTTVTSARFDQKEGFVPLGPPTGTTGVRESYQGVPTDPEEERQRRLEREAQDLQLEEMRQKVRDPYGKERFDAEQRRGDIITKAQVDRMTEEERRKSFSAVMKQLDDEAAARIEAASRKPPSKERDAMIEAIRQRVESAKEAQRQAFGIGARLSSSELYKTTPY